MLNSLLIKIGYSADTTVRSTLVYRKRINTNTHIPRFAQPWYTERELLLTYHGSLNLGILNQNYYSPIKVPPNFYNQFTFIKSANG